MWDVRVVKEQESCCRDGEEGKGSDKEEQSAQICLDSWAGGEDLDWAQSSGLDALSAFTL